MAALAVRKISSAAELRAAALPWDRLWQASDCRLPTLQADLLAVELEHFCANRRFQFLVVEQDGRFLAALPLVDHLGLPGWRLGASTGNHWSPSCDLLVDPHCDVDAVLDSLLDGLCAANWPVVDFQAINLALPRWQAWRRAIERRGVTCMARERDAVGLSRLSASWPQYVSSLSRNHRRQMRRVQRDCQALGGATLRVERAIEPADVEPLLRQGFQVEHASWKGHEHSSVHASPGIFEFYLAQAQLLAARGQLQLSFLELAGKPIAFEYGWLSKAFYHAVKVGYDERHAELSPGQLLRWLMFEKLHAEGCWSAIDFVGPLTRATTSWTNDQYMISRLTIAPRRLSGRVALAAYRMARPLLRRLKRGRAAGDSGPVERLALVERPASVERPPDLAATDPELAETHV